MNIKASYLMLTAIAAIFAFLFLTGNTILKSSKNRIINRFINGKTVTAEYQKNNVMIKYRFFEPANKSGSQLLVILHGAGERGSDNLKQLDYNTIMFIREI